MYSSNLEGNSVVNKLNQLNGILKVQNIYSDGNWSFAQPDDLQLYACFIKENVNILGEVRKDAGQQQVLISENNVKKFTSLLNRTIRLNEGLSRQERIFIQQFWCAFQ
mgnify:CR=1 FL=1